MNKKILGVKVKTLVAILLCAVLAFVVWFVIKIAKFEEVETVAKNFLSRGIL